QASAGTSRARCSAAAAASSPDASMTSSTPPSAPSERMSRMLFAFARRPLALTNTSAAKVDAARTSVPAGRACSATSAGRQTRISELGNAARLLRCASGLRVRAAGGGCHGSGDRSLDERRVGDAQMPEFIRAQLVQRRADGEDGAAEVDEDDRPGAVRGGPKLLENTAS